MSSSQLDDKPKSGGPRRRKTRGGFTLWIDDLRCRMTVRSWRRQTKKENRRSRVARRIARIPHSRLIGEILYLVGFWVEYAGVCAFRSFLRAVQAIARQAALLAISILRPFLIGIITLIEDLTEPFRRMHSGLRHISELSEVFPDDTPREVRKEKVQYFFRGIHRYLPLVWNAVSYALPVVAAVGVFSVVRAGLSRNYILEVQVGGQTVGYVDSEQVFESAREDVESRISNAQAVMAEAGNASETTEWEISPTYTLTVGGSTMTESEVANAILEASSDQIGEGTAVYIDGSLSFVTTDGDHLRTYLESVKAPYNDALDDNVTVSFVHDIRLVDGVYLLDSVVPYDTIISELNADGGPTTYTATEGETVQAVVDATGVAWDSLAALNPDLTGLDETLNDGQSLITGVSSPELLKVKVVVRSTYTVPVAYETENSESDEYDFGKKIVVQEGEDGEQEITQDTTYVDGMETEVNTVNVTTIKEPVNRIEVTGTKLASGMIATVGDQAWVWPVPQYTYVSRWMSSLHNGADICAPYGTPIIASDSGVVVTAGSHYSYGNYVVIDHGNGWTSLYAHMSSIAVTVGQAVDKQEIIGYVGSTGNSTGNHCHFELRYNGSLVSARNFFPNM